jgi:fucose 4-O-acetylase-like acetyltransferase
MMNEASLQQRKRFDHIDIAKGISILLVVLYHTALKDRDPGVMRGLSVVRLPLFFFISGVFFSYKASCKPFIFKRAEALLKPYFVTLLVVTFVMFFFTGDYKYRLFRMLYSNGTILQWPWSPAWFLPHLFAIHLSCYVINRYTPYGKIGTPYKWAAIIAMVVAGLFVIDIYSAPLQFHLAGTYVHVWGLPFSIDVLFLSCAYFLAGSLLKEQIKFIKINRALLGLAIAGLAAIVAFCNVEIDLVMRNVQNHFFGIVGSVLGIYIVLCLSKLIEHTNWLKKALLAAGNASLFILLFHAFLEAQQYRLIDAKNTRTYSALLSILFFFFVSVSIPIAMKWVVKRNAFLSLLMLPKSERQAIRDQKAQPTPATI